MATTTTATGTTTASAAITNIQGIGSGIQWNDLVDATIAAQSAQQIKPLTDQITKQNAQKDAWNQLSTLTQTLNDAANVVRRAGIGGYSASVPPSPTTSRTLLTAATTLAAAPGRYGVEVQQLAQTAKIGGSSVADKAAALGLTGTFAINGATITVAATDTLTDLQGKINTANSGATPTGVTASILSDGTAGGRLVLTRDTSGSSGITLTDGTGGIARELGFVDSRSKPVSSAVSSAAAALGLSVYPQPASIRVGNRIITADLTVDSISAIAAKINAAGGSASVLSEQYGSETRYRLVTDGNVSADSADPNSQAVIDALGMAAGTSGTVQQAVTSGAFTDASNAIATGSTLLAGLKVDGTASGLAAGDAINIRGMRGDGTAVTIGLVVGAGDTMQTLVDRINDASTGFGSGSRTATASLGPDGKIRLVDNTGGTSRLSLSLGVTHADGSLGSLGAPSVTVAGRSRQLQEGKDAIINVDGTQLTRSTNTITDGINGVTLTLSAAEAGTTLDVVVDRDVKATTDAITKFKDAYNAIRTFYDQQRTVGSPLYANTMLRGTLENLQTALRTPMSSNSTYTSLAVTGLAIDRNGLLQIDTAKFQSALASKPAEVEALFGFTGVGGAFVTATDGITRFGIGTISQQTKSLDESSVRLQARADAAQKRLDEERTALIARYTKMETLLSQLQQQGNVITNSLKTVTG
jgi:flagellar hook-associated protein 2